MKHYRSSDRAGELFVHGAVIHPWQIDQYGHMNVRFYSAIFDDASFLFWSAIGYPLNRMIEEHGVHTVAATARTDFHAELLAGETVRIEAKVIRVGRKSVTLRLVMQAADGMEVKASYETVEVFVEHGTHTPQPIPDAIRQGLLAITMQDGPA